MATEEKKILFSIKLDTGDIIVKQAALAKEIDKTREAMKKINTSTDEGRINFEKQKAELQNLQREYKNSNNILQINQRITNANKGSYEELLNSTKKLEIELKLMGQAGDTTSKKFLDLTAQVGKNKEALNVFNQGINVGTNNVGRYAESLTDIRAELKTLQGQLINLKPGTVEFQEAAKRAGELKDQINDAKDATKAFASESKTQTGLTLFKQIGSDISQLDFKGASDKAKTFTSVISSVSFKEVGAGIKDLGNSILNVGKSLLANPFTIIIASIAALGLLLKGLYDDFGRGDAALKSSRESFDKIKDSIFNLKSEIIDLEIENRKSQGKISEVEASRLKETERFNKEFLEGRKKLHEEEKANEERFQKEVENISIKHVGTEEKIEKKKQIALSELKQLANSEEKLILEKHKQNLFLIDSNNAVEIAKDNEAKLKDKIQKKEAADKKEIEIEKKKSEELIKINKEKNIAVSEAETNRRIAIIIEEGKAASDALKKRADEFNQTTKNEEDKTKLIVDIETQRAAFIKKIQDDSISGRALALEDEKNKLLEGIENERFLLEQKGLLTTEAEAKLAADKLLIQEDYNSKIIESDNEMAQARLAIASSLTSALSSLAELLISDAEDNAAFLKALAVFQIAIDTAKAISSGVASAASVPYPGNIIAIVSTVATVLANIVRAKKLLSASPPKAEKGIIIPLAEKGIILGGKPHSSGGTMISADGVPIAEAERGELLTIVNKKSTNMLRGLSSLNQLGGGIPFMERGGVPEFQTGGIAPINNSAQTENYIVGLLRNLPRPVVAVQHIIDATSNLVDVENNARI